MVFSLFLSVLPAKYTWRPNINRGYAVALFVEAGRPRVWFLKGSLRFFIYIILPAALWSWSRHSLEHKWVPGLSSGG